MIFSAKSVDMLGTPVRRVLPRAEKRMVGNFIFLDHMGPVHYTGEKSSVVGAHPHIGLATLTYLFKGQIHHRDSLGSSQVIAPGDVNWMIAGSGISHSERGVKEIPDLHGLQFWVALDDENEDCDPQFLHFPKNQIPLEKHKSYELTRVVGGGSPVPVSDGNFLEILKSHEKSVYQFAQQSREVIVYVIEGSASVKGEKLSSYQAMIQLPSQENIAIEVEASSLIAIFGGPAYKNLEGKKEKHIFWNFVSSSKDKIREAQINWNEGNFPMVPGEDERILSPEFKR